MRIDPAGFYYNEYYLYSEKQWEMAPSGVSYYSLASGVMQNAPIVVTASGYQTNLPADPWAKTMGLGKYTKVGYGYFTLSGSIPDTTKKEFSLSPDSSGRLVFNNPLSENVYIEYEAGPSGYYVLNTVDINPVRNQSGTGFLHCSVSQNPFYIILTTTNSVLVSDGYHFTRVLATVLDENNDPVPNQNVVFVIPNDSIGQLTPDKGTTIAYGGSGHATQTLEKTNSKGQARVIYTPIKTRSGIQIMQAYCQSTPSVFTYIMITQTYVVGHPFTLAINGADPSGSKLDSLDYLT